MNEDDEKRIAAQLAKAIAVICVRNSRLEDLHAGQLPISRTGDGSDIVVIDADGNRILWKDVSRIDDDEMRALMRDIVNRLYTFHLKSDDPGLRAEIERWLTVAGKWEDPELDVRMISAEVRPDR
ncbi:hypothetical protein [Roseovarius sp. MBR-6]|jgi:hypothetical protein|uniref:hypothetical protein n=1 Tax=Roseovarius sp. MBR-6 TaxID=3156459 RepID=UPI003395E987